MGYRNYAEERKIAELPISREMFYDYEGELGRDPTPADRYKFRKGLRAFRESKSTKPRGVKARFLEMIGRREHGARYPVGETPTA